MFYMLSFTDTKLGPKPLVFETIEQADNFMYIWGMIENDKPLTRMNDRQYFYPEQIGMTCIAMLFWVEGPSSHDDLYEVLEDTARRRKIAGRETQTD